MSKREQALITKGYKPFKNDIGIVESFYFKGDASLFSAQLRKEGKKATVVKNGWYEVWVKDISYKCICVDYINCNPDPVPNPDCLIHGSLRKTHNPGSNVTGEKTPPAR